MVTHIQTYFSGIIYVQRRQRENFMYEINVLTKVTPKCFLDAVHCEDPARARASIGALIFELQTSRTVINQFLFLISSPMYGSKKD